MVQLLREHHGNGNICLMIYNYISSETPIANIEGHDKRVSRIAYHPSGRFLATCWFVKILISILLPVQRTAEKVATHYLAIQ